VVHGLRYSKNENRLYFIEYLNRELYFKKYDLNGTEQFSMKLEADIVAFYADNCVITDHDDYIFIAMNKNQNVNIIKIEGDILTQKELISYEAILGFSYVKK
jgi:sugar lactone lactonase YvrE